MTVQGKGLRAKKGDLVQIHLVILTPGERSSSLPVATRAVPYEGWVKGFLLDQEAVIGDPVRIESFIGRELSGVLSDINPVYDHNFGEPQPILNSIGKNALSALVAKGRHK
jgi:2-amino-4-ketopentanoate thiolase alpha subunit